MPEFELVEVELDDGGYDENGRYYGVGQLLWKAIGDNNDIIFRAWSEQEAREHLTMVLDHYTNKKPGWPSAEIERYDIEQFCE